MLPTSASVVIALLMGIAGVGFVLWQLKRVLAYDQGNEVMREIGLAIQEGAFCFSGARIPHHCYFCRDRGSCYCHFSAMANFILFYCWSDCLGGRWLFRYVCLPCGRIRAPHQPRAGVCTKGCELLSAVALSWVCPWLASV